MCHTETWETAVSKKEIDTSGEGSHQAKTWVWEEFGDSMEKDTVSYILVYHLLHCNTRTDTNNNDNFLSLEYSYD